MANYSRQRRICQDIHDVRTERVLNAATVRTDADATFETATFVSAGRSANGMFAMAVRTDAGRFFVTYSPAAGGEWSCFCDEPLMGLSYAAIAAVRSRIAANRAQRIGVAS